MMRRFAILTIALFATSLALESAEGFWLTGAPRLAAPAEAIVGRPLTPVSVAGVARRTTRRCAVGVYYC